MKIKYIDKVFILVVAIATATVVFSGAGCNKNNTPVDVGISLIDSADQPLNNQAGGDVIITTNGVNIMVIRTRSGGANPFVALSSECTKDQCTLNFEDSDLVCNCCGSIFKLQGSIPVGPPGTVAAGPAPSALTQYNVAIKGDSLLITSQ